MNEKRQSKAANNNMTKMSELSDDGFKAAIVKMLYEQL